MNRITSSESMRERLEGVKVEIDGTQCGSLVSADKAKEAGEIWHTFACTSPI